MIYFQNKRHPAYHVESSQCAKCSSLSTVINKIYKYISFIIVAVFHLEIRKCNEHKFNQSQLSDPYPFFIPHGAKKMFKN